MLKSHNPQYALPFQLQLSALSMLHGQQMQRCALAASTADYALWLHLGSAAEDSLLKMQMLVYHLCPMEAQPT